MNDYSIVQLLLGVLFDAIPTSNRDGASFNRVSNGIYSNKFVIDGSATTFEFEFPIFNVVCVFKRETVISGWGS